MKALKVFFKVSLSLAVAGLIISFLPHGTSLAEGGFALDTQVDYRVDGDITAVSEQYHVTNQTDRQFLTKLTLSTPVDTITSIKASYADGTAIPVTAAKATTIQGGINYSYQGLTLTFPRQTYGAGKNWSFSVNYAATGLVETHGGSHTVYVPSIQADSLRDSYDVRVDVPQDFGSPHFLGATSNRVSSGSGRQYFDFTKAAIAAHSLALSFGDQSIYRVNFNFPLTNDSFNSQLEQITLPPNLNNQRVHIESLDPAPLNTHLDSGGNILADYRLRPGQKLTVKTVVTGQVNYLDYNLAASGKLGAIPADLVRQYTDATQYWQTSGAVGATAKSLSDPNKPVIQNVQAMYQYVIDHLTYNPDKIKFNIRQGAAKALAHPNNVVCLEYSDLLIAMLRSQGIPARMPVGYGYSGKLKNSTSVADSLHSWVEAYVPGIGWMTLDPTWGEKFDLFGQSDLDHFAFAVWGAKDQLPAPVMTAGHDDGYQYEQTILDYATVSQVIPAGGQATILRRTILPGLSLDEIKVTATGDQPGSYSLTHDGLSDDLGKLAPGQHLQRYRWILGTHWHQTGPLTLLESTGQNSLILVRSSIQLSNSVFNLVIGLVIAGVIWWIVLRLRPHRAKKRQLQESGHD